MSETKFTKDKAAKSLIMERVFDAPRERVWQAFTTDEINKWWGPRGWETTSKHMDFKPGGYWHYGMKCVDENQGEWFGQESWGRSVYEEIDEPNKFVYKDYFVDADNNINEEMPVMTITVEFTEQDGKTRVVSTSIFETEEAYDKVVATGVEQGATETWDRLAEYLS
ncbi:MAG: SRPBCC domain-containing protein [Acidobacteriota bacterium]